jgi:hypothetical protein
MAISSRSNSNQENSEISEGNNTFIDSGVDLISGFYSNSGIAEKDRTFRDSATDNADLSICDGESKCFCIQNEYSDSIEYSFLFLLRIEYVYLIEYSNLIEYTDILIVYVESKCLSN